MWVTRVGEPSASLIGRTLRRGIAGSPFFVTTAPCYQRSYHSSNQLSGKDGTSGAEGSSSSRKKRGSRRGRRGGKRVAARRKEERLTNDMEEWGLVRNSGDSDADSQGSSGEHHDQDFLSYHDDDTPSSNATQNAAISSIGSISLLGLSEWQVLPAEIRSAMQADPTYFHGRNGVATRWTPPSSLSTSSSDVESSPLVQAFRDIRKEQEMKSLRDDHDHEW